MPEFEFKRGMVPISGDPITYGHIALIERAKERCQTLIVAIMINEKKIGRYMFTLEERVQMTAQALRHIPGVLVIPSSGLLVDEFLRLGLPAVFRGVRNKRDEDYEDEQKALNSMILHGFGDHVHYIESRIELAHVSSSQVKGFVEMGVDISSFAPLHVKVALEKRIQGYTLVGITGGIATGKSYVAERLASRLGGTHINVDALLHDLYAEKTLGAQIVREQIAELLGQEVLVDGVLNRKLMRERLFGSPKAHILRKQIEELTAPHVMRLLRERLRKCTGLIILEWAQLIEMQMMGFVSNRVIVVTADDYRVFLAKRGLAPEDITDIAQVQISASIKAGRVSQAIEHDDFGACLYFENSLDPSVFERGMSALIAQIKAL